MVTKINIQIEKDESRYSAYCPEISGYRVEADSLDVVVDNLKEAVKLYLTKQEFQPANSTNQSLLDLFESITADMTTEGLNQLPADGAEQHDHYIYGTPKGFHRTP